MQQGLVGESQSLSHPLKAQDLLALSTTRASCASLTYDCREKHRALFAE